MPELPEVETTLRGVAPHSVGRKVSELKVRNRSMRWPVPAGIEAELKNKKLADIERRGKYLLFKFTHGTAILHLGMSGSLRVMPTNSTPEKHDHIDICFGERCLRFNDPRRFGCFLWTPEPSESHDLIQHLGPEPLSDDFNAEYLFSKSRKRKQNIKTFIMDAKVVVGVGNIYANEALFESGIHPLKAAGKLSKAKSEQLSENIKNILQNAITRGGTTLRDFVGGDGKPGYFAQELKVYGHGGEPCRTCAKPLTEKQIAKRTTVYCTQCQT